VEAAGIEPANDSDRVVGIGPPLGDPQVDNPYAAVYRERLGVDRALGDQTGLLERVPTVALKVLGRTRAQGPDRIDSPQR
jgi:hypothetical protein